MRAQTIGLLIAALGCYTMAALAESGPKAGIATGYESALDFFRTLPSGDVLDALRMVRPAAISPEERARALRTLPAEGALTPREDELQHLAQLQPIFAFHDLRDAVTIKIVDMPRAAVGWHARSILLLSRHAMELLSAGELQGIVAHEMGHDFFWDDYYDARKRRDRAALQSIELKCDGIAVLTIRRLGLDPDLVESAVRALARFNERLGPPDLANYPDTDARAHFMGDVLALPR